VPGQAEGEAHQNQVRQDEDAQGNDQMPIPSRVLAKPLLKFIDDLLVAVLYNKDIVKEHGGQSIDGQGEEDRLHPGIETVMFDKMEIDGFE